MGTVESSTSPHSGHQPRFIRSCEATSRILVLHVYYSDVPLQQSLLDLSHQQITVPETLWLIPKSNRVKDLQVSSLPKYVIASASHVRATLRAASVPWLSVWVFRIYLLQPLRWSNYCVQGRGFFGRQFWPQPSLRLNGSSRSNQKTTEEEVKSCRLMKIFIDPNELQHAVIWNIANHLINKGNGQNSVVDDDWRHFQRVDGTNKEIYWSELARFIVIAVELEGEMVKIRSNLSREFQRQLTYVSGDGRVDSRDRE